jgi:DNA polymerase III alpha subunit
LNDPGEHSDNSPVSIFDILIENKIEELFLLEDSFGGFLQAHQNCKDNNIKLNFGLRFNFLCDIEEKNDEALKSRCKYSIFAKNNEGYKRLVKIWSFAAKKGFYYTPNLDFKALKDFWNNDDLLMCVPFYDSFLHRNTLENASCIPDLEYCKPVFFLEDNDVPFDHLIRNRVETYTKSSGFSTQEVQSIYYKNKDDFLAYLTFKCINNRSTLEKPNMDHMCSNEFCFESWKEKETQDKIKKIAEDREEIHKNHASSRPLSKGYERLGLVGEYQFAKEFGFEVDESLRPEGDGGKDFPSKLGSIDVKTARKAFNLIVEEDHVKSDIYVLAQYCDESEKAKLLGWAYKKQVLAAPTKDFGYGVINHYIPKEKLYKMSTLKNKLKV